jgi:Fic family protein
VGGWGWDEASPSPQALRLFQNARRLYDRIAEFVEQGQTFAVTPELVCNFHAVATAGEPNPALPPGILRTVDVQIGRVVVLYEPPPWQDVPALLADACAPMNRSLAAHSTLHTAAYALWRINWIHPFGDGNGKTSRAVMYAILCVGFNRMLPGEPALPDLIARNPYAYWDALKAADAAWKRGLVDVSEMETLLSDLIDTQLG